MALGRALVKRWIALSIGRITIHQISIREINCVIQWIVIYPIVKFNPGVKP